MDLEALVERARTGDAEAFVELTRRFQHFAFGSALVLVRDFHQAEDVVQEALVSAWAALPTLAEPAAFPGWLRGIVRHQAFRALRRRRFDTLPLSAAENLPGEEPVPDQRWEQRESARAALAAMAGKAVGEEHAGVAQRVRAALAALRAGDAADASGPGGIELARARKLAEFFGQPFFCAEPYTKRPGVSVGRADALRGCREILDGAHDDLPLDAFHFDGSIEEIHEAARKRRAGRAKSERIESKKALSSRMRCSTRPSRVVHR